MLSYVISLSMWRWRHTRPCQNRYIWYIISVPMHQIHFEHFFMLETRKKDSKWSIFPYGWVNIGLGAVQRPSAICTHKGNPVNRGSLVTIPHYADDAHMLCHSTKCLAIIAEIKNRSNFLKIRLRQWTVEINLIILLSLTLVCIQRFSPQSHSQGNCNWQRVLRTNVFVVFSKLTRTHHWLKMPCFGHISVSVRQENIMLDILLL